MLARSEDPFGVTAKAVLHDMTMTAVEEAVAAGGGVLRLALRVPRCRHGVLAVCSACRMDDTDAEWMQDWEHL